MRPFIVVLAGALAAGSAVTEKPVAPGCRAEKGSLPTQREGSLRILPSRVPGVAVSHASWVIRRETGEDGLQENLYIVTTLHGEQKFSRDDLAFVFDAPGPHALVDTALTEFDPTDSTLTIAEPFLEPGRQVKVLTTQELRSGFSVDSVGTASQCLRTVRVVRRDSLAQALAR